MNNIDITSLDNVSLSRSDSALIEELSDSNKDPVDQAALQGALNMLFRQRNMLAYRVNELLDIATTVQSALEWKATNLQTQLDHANASIELQYRASLAKEGYTDSSG